MVYRDDGVHAGTVGPTLERRVGGTRDLRRPPKEVRAPAALTLGGVAVGLHGSEGVGHRRDCSEGAFRGVGVSLGRAWAAAEQRPEAVVELLVHVFGVEVVEAAVIHQRPDELGATEGDEGGRGAALAEPGDCRPVEAERVAEMLIAAAAQRVADQEPADRAAQNAEGSEQQ